MNLCILHHHLNRGGVSQVILNHLRSLGSASVGSELRIAVGYGGRREGWPDRLPAEAAGLDVSFFEVAGLDYDNDGTVPDAEGLARGLSAMLEQLGFAPDATVLHVHNHSLGKNVSLGGALKRLAADGFPLLLQIHDFAEDFRPDNYRRLAESFGGPGSDRFASAIYPQSAHIHYAALNQRDAGLLSRAGVAGPQLHFLPNPLPDRGALPPRAEARRRLAGRFGVPDDRRYVLYPVRGIRRKNVGEAVLWSALAGDSSTFAVTLPPINPLEKPVHQLWKNLAAESRLPTLFDVGAEPNGLAYEDNLAAADAILTTSVAEGFGMVFLEAWLTGRALVGRDLPEITADFKASGVRFPGLRSRFDIPVDVVGRDRLSSELKTAYGTTLAGFGRPVPSDVEFERQMDELISDGTVDFGALTVPLQAELIRSVCQQADLRTRIREANPWLNDVFSTTDGRLIEQNAEAVRKNYSLDVSGSRLFGLYKQVLNSDHGSAVEPLQHPERILDGFLRLDRFHPIRVAGERFAG